jgi:hypothetical protein
MLTTEKILEEFNMPGLNIEASLEPRELELFLIGCRAIERNALERAALKCDEEATWLEDLTEHEQACGAHKCAYEIRTLIDAQSKEGA